MAFYCILMFDKSQFLNALYCNGDLAPCLVYTCTVSCSVHHQSLGPSIQNVGASENNYKLA